FASLTLDCRNATGGWSQRKSHRVPPLTPGAGETASPPVSLPKHEEPAAPTRLKLALPPQEAASSSRARMAASINRVRFMDVLGQSTSSPPQDATARDLCIAT